MDLKKFKSGTFTEHYQYKSFSPSKINENWVWTDPRLNTLLADANRRLGALDAYSLQVPNVDYFIQMHVVKEATTSSRIEGTRTAVEEAVLEARDLSPEKRDDWVEVQNYIKAMNRAVSKLKKLPVSTRLLNQAHKVLLSSGRGAKKEPGEFRRSQNWIGGATLKDAVFVPPHHDEIPALMEDMENFLHNETIDVPDLVRIAIGHYQFETIHPFLDGNGRLGRLMIPLYLVSKDLLTRPILYLSDYFDRHKAMYYEKLMIVRTKSDLIQWIKFFLSAVIETSIQGVTTLKRIQKLRDKVEGKELPKLGKKFEAAKELLTHLYQKPSITAADVGTLLDVTPATANALIRDLVEVNVLQEVTGGRRNRVFLFRDYVRLFAG